MMHASYCLGKPYRALMFPYSDPAWCPYPRSQHQQVFRPASLERESGGLDGLPDWSRKQMLLLLLNEIGQAGLNEAAPMFRSALRSRDRDIRRAAVAGLLRCPEHQLEELVKLLHDESREVRGIAAQALVERRFSSSSIPPDHLNAHILIGKEPLEWRPVIGLGRGIRPILELARDGDEPSVRREAAAILRMYDAGRDRRRGLLARLWRRSSTPSDNVQGQR
jgi:hypothetical protein